MPETNYSEIFLKTFLEFSDFRQLFLSNWQSEFFDTPEERILYAILKGFWIQSHKLPTKKDLLLEINTKSKYDKIRTKLVEKVDSVFTVDLAEFTESFVRDIFIDLLRKKKLESAVKKIVDQVNTTGKVDESIIKNEIIKSLEITDDLEDLGIDYYDGDVLARMKVLQELHACHFNTGINTDLDDVLRLKRKTLVAISAQLGVGKSLFLNNLAANISQQGYNVLYLSLEMDAFDHSKRLDRITMGFHEDLYFQAMDRVDKGMTELKNNNPKRGKLFIRSYPQRSLSTLQIHSLLEIYRLKNVGIDVILLDYLTLMRPNKSQKDDSMYMRGKAISEELCALAKEERCLVFTALQVKSESYGRNRQGAEMVSESLAIPQQLDSLINLREIIVDDGDQKFFALNFEKTRDSKKSGKTIFLKLEDNLRIISASEKEIKKLEELTQKKKTTKEPYSAPELDVL